MKIFKCQFGKSASCLIRVPEDAPKKGEKYTHIVEWNGILPKKRRSEYVVWMNSVNKQLSDEWKMRFMHVFLFTADYSDAQIWLYEPDKNPARVK